MIDNDRENLDARWLTILAAKDWTAAGRFIDNLLDHRADVWDQIERLSQRHAADCARIFELERQLEIHRNGVIARPTYGPSAAAIDAAIASPMAQHFREDVENMLRAAYAVDGDPRFIDWRAESGI